MTNIVELDMAEVTLHKIVETHPIMDSNQYAAFKKDMDKRGQQQPVLLYRGKVVDGRHRYNALKELAKETILAIKLPNNITLEETQEYVESSEMRRHQTPTQLAIKGYRYYKSKGCTQKEACDSVGCSLANLKHVVALDSLGRLDVIDNLWRGIKFNVSDDARFAKMTDSLLAITSKLKRDKQLAEEFDNYDATEEKSEPSVSREELTQVNAVYALISTWDDKMKKMLVAKIYNKE